MKLTVKPRKRKKTKVEHAFGHWPACVGTRVTDWEAKLQVSVPEEVDVEDSDYEVVCLSRRGCGPRPIKD